MTIEKLRALEPLFGSWYVEAKTGQGRNSAFFRVSRSDKGSVTRMGVKVLRFPSSDKEISRIIASGKYQTVGEYLDFLEKKISMNIEKMIALGSNPNIIRFEEFQIIRESSCFYAIILMEHLKPLSEHVRSESVAPVQAVKLAVDIANALEDFRQAGIIHREIRPDNIYADKDGNFKLGDFGLSDSRADEPTDISSYIAPEIHLGKGASESSDIYSLGLLLYKLLNHNRMPFYPSFPDPVSVDFSETPQRQAP